ncbi:hypothetical protein SEPCBS57363_005837 [Sporothrix epigloea]|uniref:Translation initiation factor n=1 Tax=Sporothrix epigloea TaxID=1892477 RepID=A0ABP0E220_9PEZI
MKPAACVFTPVTALSRVFLSITGPLQMSLVAGRRKHANSAKSSRSTSLASSVSIAQPARLQENESKAQRRSVHYGAQPQHLKEGFARPLNQASRQFGTQDGARSRQQQSPRLATADDFFGPNTHVGKEESQPERPPKPAAGNGGTGTAAVWKQSNAIPGLAARVRGGNKARMPRDRDITSSHVILQNPDGSLSDPRPTGAVMRGIHSITESLVMLAYPNTEGPRDEPTSRFPVCFIVNRIAERKQEADLIAAARKKTVAKKELELSWGIESHDLGHRLKKLHEFLEKGLLVEMTLMRKKGKREATKPEAKELLRRIRETIASVPGAKETKGMEGELLRTVRLTIQGPSSKKRKEM